MSNSIFTDHYREWVRLWMAVTLIETGKLPDMWETESLYTRVTGRGTLRPINYEKMSIDYFRSKPE